MLTQKDVGQVGVGVKFDAGKPDLTLVPWMHVGARRTRMLIIPLYDWWRRSMSAADAVAEMHTVWRGLGRSLIVDMNAALLYGAQKYAPWNWEKGLASSRIYAAACRHYIEIDAGRLIDAESGLDHHCHLAFTACAIFAVSPDDRPAP